MVTPKLMAVAVVFGCQFSVQLGSFNSLENSVIAPTVRPLNGCPVKLSLMSLLPLGPESCKLHPVGVGSGDDVVTGMYTMTTLPPSCRLDLC
ncbi:hypothetical protein GOBAR_AA04657 [Gossypium barbadense]|uniref:Uncharacterized protein n=1 Tax=Gossypium barbadense TaxID=3634 RepID=A0A2P5YJZ2_GOSBA|nr:hypothetical protein GOBAR_AA04657 [Gossypium barbadense]